MTEQAYMIAWSAYACGYLLVLLVLWRWTRNWWRWPKYSLRLLWMTAMIAVLPHPDNGELLVPAVIMALLGWVMDGPEVALPALRLMGLAGGLGLFIALIATAIAARFSRGGEPDTAAAQAKADAESGQDDTTDIETAAIVEPPARA